MKCPYCKKEMHLEENVNCMYRDYSQQVDENYYGIGTSSGECPSCEKLIIHLVTGESDTNYDGEIIFTGNVVEKELIYPKIENIIVPEEVPIMYADDFIEAVNVMEISPKASAALSRRTLQLFLREHLNIKTKSLAGEIDIFLKKNDVPSYIAEAVDAIRNIGNFAAHPLKDTNTGEIINVEDGEAEWLIDVLRTLFDFYFVLPSVLEKRKSELNQKLNKLGKAKMK